MQGCHRDDDPDNNDLANLRWDYPPANLADRRRNHPAQPKPQKVCVRCGQAFEGHGRRCHACVVQIGITGADYLAEGTPLDKAADALDYPPAALFNLAKRYGGLRCIIDVHQRAPGPGDGDAEQPKRGWLRRVINRREASRQNSDAP
jgi:hypothetical protein